MDFYILKKNNELTAIPAEENKCKEYLNSGYSYVNKVAACTAKSAVKKQLSEKNRLVPIFIGVGVIFFVFSLVIFIA